MYKATSFTVLIMSAMVLFMVSASAVQENNTTSKEKISVLINTTVNNSEINNTGANITAINNTAAIKTAVSQNITAENITAENCTSVNSAAISGNNATQKENNTSIEQGNASMRELDESDAKSGYDIEKYSKDKPLYNVSAYSNIKGPFNVGGNSESSTFGIGTTAKPCLDVSENASTRYTFDLGLPSKPVVETSKFPFMCSIV